jgi:translation initiation factor 2 subunit 1
VFLACLQELYKQLAWPLYKGYGHAFEAFKNMVQDDGAAIFKKLEEDRGPLTVLTPQV